MRRSYATHVLLRKYHYSTTSTFTTKMTTPIDVLADSDPEQVRLMGEEVILVDHEDKVIGSVSKKESHLTSNNLPLHRAFSVFLFDTQGRMLLQQRAASKVTFPSYWTNTVCSHPLHTPSELGVDVNDNKIIGPKRAALRKLTQELGVKKGALTPDDLHYLTRIHYRANCDDGVWGEHEIDYIFFAQKDVEMSPEPNEVSAVQYVTEQELEALFREANNSETVLLTPWFRYIVESFGWSWWRKLLDKGTPGLKEIRDTRTIYAMGACGPHCSSN